MGLEETLGAVGEVGLFVLLLKGRCCLVPPAWSPLRAYVCCVVPLRAYVCVQWRLLSAVEPGLYHKRFLRMVERVFPTSKSSARQERAATSSLIRRRML